MEKAEHAARYLASLGLVKDEGKAKEALQKVMDDDYIPGGKVCHKTRNLRPAPPGKRCCVQTGEDVQSGPFYCGEPATLIADVADEDGKGRHQTTCACKHHEHVLRSLEE